MSTGLSASFARALQRATAGDTLDLLVLRGQAQPQGNGTPLSGHPVLADSGHSLLMSQNAALIRPASRLQMATIIAWQQGEILFQDAILGTAVEEYNRYLSRKIIIVDPDLASIPVGGLFTSSDPTAFLKAVSLGLGVHVSTSDSAYLLTR